MPQAPQQPGFPSLIATIHRFFSTSLYRQLRADGIGLTGAQWRVIANLNHRDGPTQSELAERLLIEKAPLGTMLDKLEQKGLIERRPDGSDRRVRRVYMTAAAAPLLPIIEQQAQALRAQCAAGLSPAEEQQLVDLLTRIQNNLLDIRQQTSDDSNN